MHICEYPYSFDNCHKTNKATIFWLEFMKTRNTKISSGVGQSVFLPSERFKNQPKKIHCFLSKL